MLDLTPSVGLVLDTSVWINLLATEEMGSIVGALGVLCHAPEQVVWEITRHPVSGIDFQPERHPLRAAGSGVSILTLAAAELELFLEIVGAPAVDALGDGEAAAIAVAVTRGLELVIDDRKARRVLRERFSQVRTHWTVDLIRAAPVSSALGASRVNECLDKAVRFGRMHLPH